MFLKKSLCTMMILACLTGCTSTDPEASWAFSEQGISAAMLSEDASVALVATLEGTAEFWIMGEAKPTYVWSHPDKEAKSYNAVTLSANGEIAATATNTEINLWRTRDGSSYGYLTVPGDVRAIALSPTGRYVLIGQNNYTAAIYDLKQRKWLGSYHHEEGINSVAISNNGQFALTGSDDKTAKLWSIQDRKLLQTWTHKRRVTKVAFSPDDQFVLSSASQAGSYVWERESGAQVSRLQLGNQFTRLLKEAPLTFSTVRFIDDEKILTGSPPEQVRLWELRSGDMLKQWDLPRRSHWKPTSAIVYAVALSDDKKYLLAAAADGTGHRWIFND